MNINIAELKHLIFSEDKAIQDYLLNIEIQKKLNNHYFSDKLVLLAALPKSASSIIGDCIALIHPYKGAKNRKYATYMLANQDSDLRPEIVKDFPNGGILKFHTKATGKNLKVIDLLNIKNIILFRSPIDQLCAMYCQAINSPMQKTSLANNSFMYDHIYPLDPKYFLEGKQIDIALKYLIEDGYLHNSLTWMIDWLKFRNLQNSLIITYEDFYSKIEHVIEKIYYFLGGNDFNNSLIDSCKKLYTSYPIARENRFKYPRGYTGEINVWCKYLNESHLKHYKRVVSNFLEYYPGANLILQYYPDILNLVSN